MKKRVLFVCTHNSARSQMAEGLLNALCGSQYEAFSGGIIPSVVNPFAIKAMAEIGIDISANRSKGIDEFKWMVIDYVVTVCDNAKEYCLTPPAHGKHLHKSLSDPSGVKGDDDERLTAFRRCRDEIRDWIHKTFCK